MQILIFALILGTAYVAQPTTTASPTFPTTTTGPPAKTTEATTTNTTPRHHTNFVYYPTTAAPTVPTVQEKLPPTGLPPPDYHHHQHSSTEVVRGGATNVPPTLPFEHGMERPSPATAPPSLPSEAPAPYNQKAVVHEKVKEASPDKTTTKNSANHDNDLVSCAESTANKIRRSFCRIAILSRKLPSFSRFKNMTNIMATKQQH
ncbi:hypothetical protein Fcan01_16952 [Folsomia candida]|uniref:Uncharacterized protein n=1 Tax=Folsomia candida TaxID=158441 RepID=A0A226DUB8_FOLCA|nr:hypothetical protein Fcan01_16952 [Folsomia candida]